MKKKVIILLIFVGIAMVTLLVFRQRKLIENFMERGDSNSLQQNTSEPVLAVFSFEPNATNRLIDTFFHYTLKLNETDGRYFKKEEFARVADSIPLMITIETWGNFSPSNLNNPLEDMVKGRFDHFIEQLCKELIADRPNVYFRFNPDMEVPVNRYPWQYQGGPAYVAAFRHFAELVKSFAPQVMQVWGPAGYPGTEEFYPGDDVVDATSVTLKSDSEMTLNVYPRNYPVEYDVLRRLHRMRFFDNPVFVLGSGTNANDSVDVRLVSKITEIINEERDIVYSNDNFKRPVLNSREKWKEEFEFGLYDPQSQLTEERPVTVEHLFADFGNLHDGTFHKNFNDVVKREHNVIVTFEPFRNPGGKTDHQILQHIIEGMYDKEIKQLYSIILSTNRKVYLRYAHEMEIPITRYPWQSQNPITYIKSFRYFMNFRDSLPQNIKRVWGPAGDRGSLEWWPGNDVVDFISFAIYGLPDKNITDPEKQESFETIFNRKYWRFRWVDKPIFITEFGVKGPEEYQTKWLEAAAKVIRSNPQIKGINYFNMSDTPLAWGEIKPPDWSITKESFYRFLEALNED